MNAENINQAGYTATHSETMGDIGKDIFEFLRKFECEKLGRN